LDYIHEKNTSNINTFLLTLVNNYENIVKWIIILLEYKANHDQTIGKNNGIIKIHFLFKFVF